MMKSYKGKLLLEMSRSNTLKKIQTTKVLLTLKQLLSHAWTREAISHPGSVSITIL